jgi:hypothetical protein
VQTPCNRRAILQSPCNRLAIALQSPCNRLAIIARSPHNCRANAMQSRTIALQFAVQAVLSLPCYLLSIVFCDSLPFITRFLRAFYLLSTYPWFRHTLRPFSLDRSRSKIKNPHPDDELTDVYFTESTRVKKNAIVFKVLPWISSSIVL